MRRLATQIHLTILAALVLFAILAGAAWIHGPGLREELQLTDALAVTVADLLPPPDRSPEELQAAVDRLAVRFGMDAAVFSPTGERLAWLGSPLPLPRWSGPAAHFARAGFRGGLSVALRLPDGRVVAAARPHLDRRHIATVVVTMGLLALAVAVGAWPLVRRLTRRLENLRRRVEDLGGGDLAARAPVEGRDEIAGLARSFNRAADRIQALVEAQRRQLAFASHELRSPLARLRVSLEMMKGDPSLKEQAARDVAELDGLIDELLEASRLQAQRGPGRVEDRGPPRARRRGGGARRRGRRRRAGRPARRPAPAAAPRAEPPRQRAAPRRGSARGGARGDAAGRRGAPLGERPGARRGGGRARARLRAVPPALRRARTGSGYGLGLALVRQIARAHGGEVRCLARDGGGTVFEVDLPGAP